MLIGIGVLVYLLFFYMTKLRGNNYVFAIFKVTSFS